MADAVPAPEADFITPALASDLEKGVLELATKDMVAGCFAAVVRGGEIAWELPFGKADITSGADFNRHTLFKIASVTKTFTAVAIFQLRDRGELDLDDPLSKFIPEVSGAAGLKGRADEITIRRLLSHRAGIGSSAPTGTPYFSERKPPGREEALASLVNLEVDVDPDGPPRYSNLGFALLGEVISRVSGRSYQDVIVEDICKPLGMNSTGFRSSGFTGDVATGYSRLHPGSDVRVEEFPELQFEASAGGMISNAADLAKWAQFHMSEEDSPVLSVLSRKEMRQPQHLAPDWSRGVCLNWFADRVADVVAFGHGGGIPGFVTQFKMVPDAAGGFAAITFVNIWPCDAPIADRLIELVAADAKSRIENAPPPEVRLATEPPEEVAAYPGIYFFDEIAFIWIEWSGDSLTVRLQDPTRPIGGPARLTPTDRPNVFVVDSGIFARGTLRFETGDDGEVVGFHWDAFLVRKLSDLR